LVERRLGDREGNSARRSTPIGHAALLVSGDAKAALAEAERARSDSYGFANPLQLRACVYLALPVSGHRSRRVMRTHDQATKQASFTDRLARILCVRVTFRGESLEEVARYLSVHPRTLNRRL